MQNIRLKFSKLSNLNIVTIWQILPSSEMGHAQPLKILDNVVWNFSPWSFVLWSSFNWTASIYLLLTSTNAKIGIYLTPYLVEPKTSKIRFLQLQSMVVTRLIPIFVMTACLAKPYLNLLDQLKEKCTTFDFVGIKLLNFIWSRISIPAPVLPPYPHPRSLLSCQKNHTILMCIKGASILWEVEWPAYIVRLLFSLN